MSDKQYLGPGQSTTFPTWPISTTVFTVNESPKFEMGWFQMKAGISDPEVNHAPPGQYAWPRNFGPFGVTVTNTGTVPLTVWTE